MDNEHELEFGDHLFGFRETDLQSMGIFRNNDDPESPVVVIRVRVDPETGEGFLIEDDQD